MVTYNLKYKDYNIPINIERKKIKHLYIRVYPDLSVHVKAPQRALKYIVNKQIAERGDWIIKQIEKYKSQPQKALPKQYIHGEQHLYLGQLYNLHISYAARTKVSIKDNNIIIQTKNYTYSTAIKKALYNWYRKQADIIFNERTDICFAHFCNYHKNFVRPFVAIRNMKSRWGSMSVPKNGIRCMCLNLQLIQNNIEQLDYVIMHELAHMIEHNHSKAYYAILNKLMPDWKARKANLFL